MKIALIAPPFISVPPKNYGGTELFLAELCAGLAEREIDVTLYTNGESRTPVPMKWIYEKEEWPVSGDLELSLKAANHVAWAVHDAVDYADIIHMNSARGIPLTRFCRAPVVYTVHHPFEQSLADFYALYPQIWYVTISHFQKDQLGLPRMRNIHHGVDLSKYRFRKNKQDYLCFLGRVAPPKGTHIAIEIARRAGIPLKIAGEIQPAYQDYWQTMVKPKVDGRFIEFLGEVDLEEKNELLANARAMLFPIQWDEPFGLVLVESMACGTPVLAMPGGSVGEIVKEGVSGCVRSSAPELADCAVNCAFDPAGVRRHAETYFSRERMVQDYLELYQAILRDQIPAEVHGAA
ncbi:MAG TPA: glycosyltransferase family 4 protein [Terriglobales bacterium]|nr:glycosyltransferase family 4 protein [Terriglobales bacterium]